MPSPHHHAPGVRRALAASLAGIAAVAGLAAAPADAAPQRAAAKAKLQRALDRVVAAGAPGAAVLVRDGDRTIRLASGYGRLGPKTPMRAAHPTRIGGVTKTFVATVVLQLVDEGKLALDDTVGRWLPGAIANGGAISIRQLLNHTSGIFSYDKEPSVFEPYLEGDLTRIFDQAEGVRIAADHGPLFAPGSKLAYSNTNYVLLGIIVQAATGKPIGAELRDRIFAPLHLGHTAYPLTSAIAGRHTHGYLGATDVTALSPTLLGAAGAIVSNPADVATFYRALLAGGLLSPAGLASMQQIDAVATGGVADAGIRGGGWGLGLLRERFPCGIAWGHDSETPGYMAAAWSSAEGARQVVVVVNTSFGHDAPVSAAMRQVLTRAYCES